MWRKVTNCFRVVIGNEWDGEREELADVERIRRWGWETVVANADEVRAHDSAFSRARKYCQDREGRDVEGNNAEGRCKCEDGLEGD